MSSALTSPPSSSSASSSADSTCFSFAAASPVCELMRLVGDDGEPLALVAASLRTASRAKGKVWMVQTTIFLPPDSASASLPLLLPSLVDDDLDHALRALEVEERLLQLRVDDVAVGDDQHRVEHLLVVGVVQLGEEVRRPGDGVGLARAGRVLDQVFAARALRAARRPAACG